jgi:hypothetical protein
MTSGISPHVVSPVLASASQTQLTETTQFIFGQPLKDWSQQMRGLPVMRLGKLRCGDWGKRDCGSTDFWVGACRDVR